MLSCLGFIVLAVIAYFLLFPQSTFIIFSKPGGGTVTFSRTSISFESAPAHYPVNGFDHVGQYVSQLLVPTNSFKSLSMFTPDGSRGFGLDAQNGVVHATLTTEWRQEVQREAAVRSFFSALGIAPSRDYLAGNGGVPDATRILEYPITGNPAEITALTKRILQQLCSVSATEALDINYTEKK